MSNISITTVYSLITLCIATIIAAAIAIWRLMHNAKSMTTQIAILLHENTELHNLSLAVNDTVAMLLFDYKGNLTHINDTFKHMHGMTDNSYRNDVGSTIGDYMTWCDYKGKLPTSSPISFVSKVTDSQGDIIWKQSTITPSFDAMSKPNYIITELDITDVKVAEQELQQQKKRSEELLHNMLPAEIVEELQVKGTAAPRIYRNASVLFADIKDFTQWTERISPRELIDTLQELFSAFDDVLSANYIEKIKTVGDAYMCAGGLPMQNRSHPFDIILAAFGLQRAIRNLDDKRAKNGDDPWLLRIGIHTGPVVTGVIGKIRTVYDIWGDTVNTANRLEAECQPGKVNISQATYNEVKDYFECEYRGKIPAKHKGEIDMYFANRLKPEYSADNEGLIPNKLFLNMLSEL